ncbi:hypothetical protein [uncultured Lactobacillus sp.]|uniref:hypothetical protein n=1 Tax=uncultured Lactobacillus sp. TaxID=153152 RepID=UPI0026139D54|nr:hypothetical protein [uncultured Lactobacillus sp.]
MKKVTTISLLIALSLSLTACSNNQNTKTTHSRQAKSTKIIRDTKKKTKSHKKKVIKKKTTVDQKKAAPQKQSQPNNSAQTQNTNNQSQQSSSAPHRQLTQGEINMQRGYDPNGAPLLPGQDHAAGANPDGTPDAWVQGQIDWAKRNGLMNPDGSPTEKEKQIEHQVANDSFDPDPASDDTDY